MKTPLSRNILFCRIIAILFLIMIVRYRAIFVLVKDPSSSIYSIIIVAVFYLLNVVSMVGLFIPRAWGFIVSYIAIPVSTLLFAISYFSFIVDWLPIRAGLIVTPLLNAVLLVVIISLHRQRRRLLSQ